MHHLGIPSPHVEGLSKVKNSYIKNAYYNICDDYGVNAEEMWMNEDWFYMTAYANFDDGGKATQRSPPDNLK